MKILFIIFIFIVSIYADMSQNIDGVQYQYRTSIYAQKSGYVETSYHSSGGNDTLDNFNSWNLQLGSMSVSNSNGSTCNSTNTIRDEYDNKISYNIYCYYSKEVLYMSFPTSGDDRYVVTNHITGEVRDLAYSVDGDMVDFSNNTNEIKEIFDNASLNLTVTENPSFLDFNGDGSYTQDEYDADRLISQSVYDQYNNMTDYNEWYDDGTYSNQILGTDGSYIKDYYGSDDIIVEKIVNNSDSSYSHNFYDSDGSYSQDNYDVSGNLFSTNDYDSNGNLYSDSIVNNYDGDGNLVSTTTTNDDGSYSTTTLPTINDDGSSTTSTSNFDSLGNSTSSSSTTTNSDGSSTTSSSSSNSGDGGLDTTSNYDVDGNLIDTGSNCNDGAPALLLNDSSYTCDRTCSQVNYYTDLTGYCKQPNCDINIPVGWIHTADLNLCDNFSTTQYTASNKLTGNAYCPDSCYLKPIVINNPSEDDYYDIGDYAFDYNDYVADLTDWNDDTVDSENWDMDYEIVNNINDTQTLNENDINDYVASNGMPPINDNVAPPAPIDNDNNNDGVVDNHSSNYNSNSNLSGAPNQGGGSGGNSLSDDLRNLGAAVNSNTNAVLNNNNETAENTEATTGLTGKIGDLIDTITGLTNGNIDYAQTALNGVTDKYTKFSLVENSECGAIEPVTFTLTNGKTYEVLSQGFLNTLPLDIIRQMILFTFTLAGVVMALRQA